MFCKFGLSHLFDQDETVHNKFQRIYNMDCIYNFTNTKQKLQISILYISNVSGALNLKSFLQTVWLESSKWFYNFSLFLHCVQGFTDNAVISEDLSALYQIIELFDKWMTHCLMLFFGTWSIALAFLYKIPQCFRSRFYFHLQLEKIWINSSSARPPLIAVLPWGSKTSGNAFIWISTSKCKQDLFLIHCDFYISKKLSQTALNTVKICIILSHILSLF